MCKHQFVQVALDTAAKRAWVQCLDCKQRLPNYRVVADWDAQQFVFYKKPDIQESVDVDR